MTRTFVSGTSTAAASVTVRWYGTSTAATIYADPAGSSISNPVTAAYDGAYSFWIDNGHYTVVNGTPTGNSELRIQSTNVGQQVPGTAPSDIKLDPFLSSSTASVEAFYEGMVAGTQTLGGASYTGTITETKDGIGATSTDGLVLVNNTAAADSAQQWSPRIRFRGYGWETIGADSSKSGDWIVENQMIQSTNTVPDSKLAFSYSASGGAYAEYMSVGTVTGYLSVFGLTIGDAGNIDLNATTGTKLGTGTTQKLAFWGSTPVVQQAAVADASGGATVDAEARTALNDLLAKLRTIGLIAT